MTETQADHPDDITNTSHHTRREDGHRQTVIDLVKRSRFAMLTTRTAEGTMISRPLTVQEVTEEGDIYFIVPGDGDAAREADRAEVNLGFSHDMAFASVAGTGEILHDRDKLEQLWDIGTQAWSDKDETPRTPPKSCSSFMVRRPSTGMRPPNRLWPLACSRACSPMRSRPAKAALRSCDSYSGQS